MLWLGIVLIFLGFLILQYVAHGMSEPFFNRPLIFHRTGPVIALQLAWMLLLGGGIACLFIVNWIIGACAVALFAALWFQGWLKSRDRAVVSRLLRGVQTNASAS